MSDSNADTLKQPSSNRTFELVHIQQFAARENGRYRSRRETEREKDIDLLRFILGELEGMQQRLGELRFAVAAMTTLVKDKLEHG